MGHKGPIEHVAGGEADVEQSHWAEEEELPKATDTETDSAAVDAAHARGGRGGGCRAECVEKEDMYKIGRAHV